MFCSTWVSECVCDSVFEFSFQSVRRVSLAVYHILCYFAIYWAKKREIFKYRNSRTVSHTHHFVSLLLLLRPSFSAAVHLFLLHLCTYRLELLLSSCVSKLYSNCVDSLILIVVSQFTYSQPTSHVCVCVYFLFEFWHKEECEWCIRLYSNISNRN